MRKLKIYIDINYPRRLVDALIKIHSLQKNKQFELVRGSHYNKNSPELKDAIYLLIDYKKRGEDITTQKHFEDGCRVIACKAGSDEKLDMFEFSMTVFRVWPYILEKATEEYNPFLYTFKYKGKRLSSKR